MTLQRNQQLLYLPAPTGGLNFRDPWFGMESQFAVDLKNVRPDYNFSACRYPMQIVGETTLTSTSTVLRPLPTVSGVAKTFLATTLSGAVFSSSVANGIASIGTGSSIKAGSAAFRGKLFVAGDGITPIDVVASGVSATKANTAWTGPTLTTLANPWVYRDRLYFTNGVTSAYFGEINGIAGALTEFPLASQITTGSLLLFGGRTSSVNDASFDDLCVFVTTSGEVIVYQGEDPKSADWKLIGRYYIAPPVHNQSFFYYGADLHIITTQGIVAMQDILQDKKEGSKYVTISRMIDPVLAQAAAVARAGSIPQVYFSAAISSTENLLYVLAPNKTATDAGFYVMNLTTKAWSWYQCPPNTGLLGGLANDDSDAFYLTRNFDGDTAATFMWQTGKAGTVDLSLIGSVSYPISWHSQSAFTNNRDNRNKKFNKIRPLVQYQTQVEVSSYSDFSATPIASTAVNVDANTINKKFYDINREGNFLSVKVAGVSNADLSAVPNFYGAFISYEPGSDVP